MLHIELFPGVFEFIHTAFHLFEVRIYLSPVLIIDIDYLYQALLEHQSLFFGLNARVIQTIALFLQAFPATVTSNRNPA